MFLPFLFSSFWFDFILHVALWFWRSSFDYYQKLLSLPLKLWTGKKCKVLRLTSIHVDLSSYVWIGSFVHAKYQKIIFYHRECKGLERGKTLSCTNLFFSFIHKAIFYIQVKPVFSSILTSWEWLVIIMSNSTILNSFYELAYLCFWLQKC